MGAAGSLAIALDGVLTTLEPLQHAVGQAGKAAARTHLDRASGGDGRMSGIPRSHRLGTGYDMPTGSGPVVLNLRPKGLVILLDTGRKRAKTVRPRTFRAMRTPHGFRASYRSGPSRGRRFLGELDRQLELDLPLAVGRELDRLFGAL